MDRLGSKGAWAEQIPFIFFVSKSTKPRLTVVIGKGTIPAFLAACQAMQRLELGGRVIGIVPPDEYSPPPDVAELITFRYSAFSRLMSGDLDALAGAAGPGEVGCLILGADILRQIDATSLEMLRSRLSADAVVLAMGGADGTGAASCQSMLDRGVSFSFMHGDGLQVRAGTGGPGAMLPQLLDQAGNDPALGFAISQAFLRLGQGLRSRQRASDAHAAVERLELDLSQARESSMLRWKRCAPASATGRPACRSCSTSRRGRWLPKRR
ncbi:hypothetical protein ACFQY5_35450 [Paeniroseomonas aquatica]|uniref:hypothetical protein n=1 Tax=Paeniroseomonas aquatica TaxID=373043 RepID=UPI00361A6E9D